MIPAPTRTLTWRPTETNGRPGDPVEFEVTVTEYEYLDGLRAQIAAATPGKSRTAKINELRTLLDLHAIFDAHHVPQAVTDALADVAEAEDNGFVIPAGIKAGMSVGQLRMDAPGSLGLEQVESEGDSPEVVDAVREAAIARADGAVSGDWKAHAQAVIEATARRYETFTSEEVWAMGLRKPQNGSSDGDALGPAMRRARASGIIEATDELRQTTARAQRHNNPKRVWRSLIYEGSGSGQDRATA